MTIDETTTPQGEEQPKGEPIESAVPASNDQPEPSAPIAEEAPFPDSPATNADDATVPSAAEHAGPLTQPATADVEPTPAPAEASAPVPAEEPPVQEPIAPQQPAAVGTASDTHLFEAAMREMETGEEAGDFRRLSKGEKVDATVIQVDRDRVFVDLGRKSEGIIPLNELATEQLENAADAVKVGDKIKVVVIKPEGGDGNAIVSKKMADFDKVWDKIVHAFETGEMLSAQVVERVKGGLVVDIGVRGFVPMTHVGNGKIRNIEKFVGQELDLKIIELDRERRKVVLSNREAEEKRRNEAREALFANVKPGDVLEGTVRRLTDYGAFVDLGGVDGLLHISEMSWMRISHPKEVLKEGQKIKVMVLRIDPGTEKVSLGHRQVLPDPWNAIREAYTQNQKLTVKIGRLVQSGAFVKLPEGAEAFLPLSEISHRRLRRPEEALEEGQEVEVQIIDLRPDERRMVLSIRALGGGASVGVDMRTPTAPSFDDDDMRRGGGKKGKKGKGGGRRGREDDDLEEMSGRRGFATGGATIGERLGLLKGFKIQEDEDEDVVDEDAHEETHEEPREEASPETSSDE